MNQRRRSTSERIVAAGLATAACAGLVGVIGVRTMEESAAATASPAPDTTALAPVEPTTASGLTQADLEAYAAQLQTQSSQLDAYRLQLMRLTKKISRQSTAPPQAGTTHAPTTAANRTTPVPKAAPKPRPAPRPVAKPAPKPLPAPKPASNSKSS